MDNEHLIKCSLELISNKGIISGVKLMTSDVVELI